MHYERATHFEKVEAVMGGEFAELLTYELEWYGEGILIGPIQS
jgi:hypothetical protein